MAVQNTGYLQRKKMRKYRSVQVLAFFIALYLISVLSLMLPLRPKVSQSEKRKLAEFPSFTLSGFLDGEFFAGIDRWFSDTFPFRETLIGWNTAIWNLSGIHTRTVVGEVGQGDEIPDVITTAPASSTASTAPVTTTTALSTTTASTTTVSTAKTTATKAATGSTHAPGNDPLDSQQLGGVLYAGNSGYEYYTFSREQTDRYIRLINAVGNKLAGKATVYDVVVPNSMGVMLSDEYKKRNGITTSDQRQAIAYMAASMNQNVRPVEIFDTLREHWEEYIYFRTDHHWTATGAYYAYTRFAAVKGFAPAALADYETQEYPGFLGTFYANGGKPAALGKTPDTVVAYLPKSTNAM
ncbi:MAG: DHHW family protein, partial [Acutalibacteraceae bacterium]